MHELKVIAAVKLHLNTTKIKQKQQTFFVLQLGLNWAAPKDHQKFSLSPLIGPSIYTFWMPSSSFWVLVALDFTQKK